MNDRTQLEMLAIGKRYGNLNVLCDVNLTVKSGEFISLTGDSGAGKSTLLHLLGCLDKPTSGAYFLEGQEVSSLTDESLSRVRNQHIGFVFQSGHFVDYLTISENVSLPGFYEFKSDWNSLRGRALLLLDMVGLSHRTEHLPAELSGGERQRAAIARALFNQPGLILADEPTGNLDGRNADSVMSTLTQLNHDGHTIILVTHDMGLADQAGKHYRLTAGQLQAR